MFHPGYVLNDGKDVDTPLLDGVLERAKHLCDEWCTIRRELQYVPWPSLLFLALDHADVARQVEGFKKAGFSVQKALGYVHSHLPEHLMTAGVMAFLFGETWNVERRSGFPPEEEELGVAPPFKGFHSKVPTADELREFIQRDYEESVGPEATEHLLQAILATDRWTREKREKRVKKFKDHNQPGESFDQSKNIITEYRTQLSTAETQQKYDKLVPMLQQYPPDELKEVLQELTSEGDGNLQQVLQMVAAEDLKNLEEQLEAELGTILKDPAKEDESKE